MRSHESDGTGDGAPQAPRRRVPLTQLLFCVVTIAVFAVTRQPLIVLLAVVLGAPLFEPVFDWLADHTDPWLGRQARLLPTGVRSLLPSVRSRAARALSWAMVLVILALVLLNYTPLTPATSRLDDWLCTHVAAAPTGACRSGLGTTPVTLADGIIRIGLIDGADQGPYDTSRRSGAERAAEAAIFRNDRRDCAGDHVTLVVATALSRTVDDTSLSADEVGIEDLRGSLLAQESYNGDPAHRTRLCLAVANLGNLDSIEHTDSVAQVVQQIVLYARHDPTFVGVVGFPFSSSAAQALQALARLGHPEIPIVSPSVTSDGLDAARGFWRIASTDQVQARALVDFLAWRLGAAPAAPAAPQARVVVLIDDDDAYSQSLGNRFLLDVNQALDPRLHAVEAGYHVQDAASIAAAVRRAGPADYVMLAGYAYDLGSLEAALQAAGAGATILGGDGLYDLERYNDHPFAPVFATGYAPPLGPDLVGSEPCPGRFAREYGSAFGAPVTAVGGPSSITFLGAHAILSYDAVCMYGKALLDFEANPAQKGSVAGALPTVSFDGLSGHTAFSDQGSAPSVPDSKFVYVMCTDRSPTPRLAARVVAGAAGAALVRPGQGASQSSPCPAG